MTKAPAAWDRSEAYARDIRVASVAALSVVISAFLFLRLPEVKPLSAGSVNKWIELDSQSVLVVEPPKPPDAPPPRPRDFVASDNGAATDPGVGMSQEQYDSSRISAPSDFRIPTVIWSKVERKPQLIKEVVPEYPGLARAAGIEGMTVVSIIIDTSGLVESAGVYSSSGNQSLDEAALAAARQLRFKPGYQRDRPVRVEANMPFRFRLN